MGEKGHHSHTEAKKENPPPTSHGKSQTTREIGIGGGKDLFLDSMVDHWLDGRGGGFCFLAIGGGGGRGIGVKAGGDRRRADQTVLDLNFVREKSTLLRDVFWTLFPGCFSQER